MWPFRKKKIEPANQPMVTFMSSDDFVKFCFGEDGNSGIAGPMKKDHYDPWAGVDKE